MLKTELCKDEGGNTENTALSSQHPLGSENLIIYMLVKLRQAIMRGQDSVTKDIPLGVQQQCFSICEGNFLSDLGNAISLNPPFRVQILFNLKRR